MRHLTWIDELIFSTIWPDRPLGILWRVVVVHRNAFPFYCPDPINSLIIKKHFCLDGKIVLKKMRIMLESPAIGKMIWPFNRENGWPQMISFEMDLPCCFWLFLLLPKWLALKLIYAFSDCFYFFLIFLINKSS